MRAMSRFPRGDLSLRSFAEFDEIAMLCREAKALHVALLWATLQGI
jgi:hypothetical protein